MRSWDEGITALWKYNFFLLVNSTCNFFTHFIFEQVTFWLILIKHCIRQFYTKTGHFIVWRLRNTLNLDGFFVIITSKSKTTSCTWNLSVLHLYWSMCHERYTAPQLRKHLCKCFPGTIICVRRPRFQSSLSVQAPIYFNTWCNETHFLPFTHHTFFYTTIMLRVCGLSTFRGRF